ncbi:hypothetical protein GBAR_LOCUS17220 [Geodia barretti]|uniref:Uncharacterized protein n=1 Tax=Geodia barretti TaxID=519541 RepID=A0AA35SJN7_GEOBA|nr:hypothetical protein GBAR_LOCUS17220 [Geodia barretti]
MPVFDPTCPFYVSREENSVAKSGIFLRHDNSDRAPRSIAVAKGAEPIMATPTTPVGDKRKKAFREPILF